MIDAQSALIYVMVISSAADSDMTDRELETIGDTVKMLPVFEGFDMEKLPQIARECASLLQDPDGLEKAFDAVWESLPERLRETAYALSCDIVAADGLATQEELRLLELLRHRLDVGRLEAAAIERGARARHMPAM